MSKPFDITAIVLTAAVCSITQAEVTCMGSGSTDSPHQLCIMPIDLAVLGASSFASYTDSPDLNMVYSDALFDQDSDASDLYTLAVMNSMPQLLDRPNSMPSEFIERMSF